MFGQIDYPAADEWTAVVDAYHERPAILEIGDPHIDGIGSVVCAAVTPLRSKTSPSAVSRPWKSAPYHDAMPVWS
jgi:hypothetical protein